MKHKKLSLHLSQLQKNDELLYVWEGDLEYWRITHIDLSADTVSLVSTRSEDTMEGFRISTLGVNWYVTDMSLARINGTTLIM